MLLQVSGGLGQALLPLPVVHFKKLVPNSKLLATLGFCVNWPSCPLGVRVHTLPKLSVAKGANLHTVHHGHPHNSAFLPSLQALIIVVRWPDAKPRLAATT